MPRFRIEYESHAKDSIAFYEKLMLVLDGSHRLIEEIPCECELCKPKPKSDSSHWAIAEND